jgi:hypothetical protein
MSAGESVDATGKSSRCARKRLGQVELGLTILTCPRVGSIPNSHSSTATQIGKGSPYFCW